jgi:hypothetical protein
MEKDKIIIDQLLGQWDSTIEKITQQFDALATWAIDEEVAPGRNTVLFIIGHLAVFQDRMIEAMELGERFFPELDEFFANPQNTQTLYPGFIELREKWITVSQYLAKAFRKLNIDDWLSKHHYVSESDFLREPHRNKLAILISRYAHIYSHMGQLRLVKQKT